MLDVKLQNFRKIKYETTDLGPGKAFLALKSKVWYTKRNIYKLDFTKFVFALWKVLLTRVKRQGPDWENIY